MSDTVIANETTTMADIDVCKAISDDLQHYFPHHMWLVGCSHDGGTIFIDLPYEKPPHLRNMGMLLHLSTVLGADGRKKVMRAGGELLERFGLPRSGAKPEASAMAKEHGLDIDNAVTKSKF